MIKKIIYYLVITIVTSTFLYAEEDFEVDLEKEVLTLSNATDKIKWELMLISGSVLYTGAKNWNWGSRNSFKFNDEGWFQIDTGSAGADKLGHLYSSYLINEFFNKGLLSKTNDKVGAAFYSALYSSTIMLGVEIFDGYSDDHGFSYEDLIMNTSGIAISYLKNTVPGLDDKLDLRVEYQPTKLHSDKPTIDYSGYKYIAVLRLSGFKKLRETPLKYLELQVGYHTEGFKRGEEANYTEKYTQTYLAVSLNLSEILFKPLKKYTDSSLLDYTDTFFRYYQSPAYLSTTIHERTLAY